MFIHNTQNRAYHCLKVTFTTHQSKRKRGDKNEEGGSSEGGWLEADEPSGVDKPSRAIGLSGIVLPLGTF